MNIEKLCICPVCLEILKSPVILSCSHNLCYECANRVISISKISQESASYFNCPYCRTKNLLLSASADFLPRNKILEQIILDWQISNTTLKSIKCQLCKDNPLEAINECLACEAILCSTCTTNHISKSRFAHHKVLPICKARRVLCTEHFEELEWFCTTEKVLLCSICLPKHQDHHVLNKIQAGDALKQEAQWCKKQLKKVQKQVKKDINGLEEGFKVLESAELGSLTELDDLCNKNIEEVNRFRLETKKKIQEIYAGLRSQLDLRVNRMNVISNSISQVSQTEDDLEFLQSSYPYLAISTGNSQITTPNIIYTQFQLPVIHLSTPTHHLYYLNRGTREFYAYSVSNKEIQIKELPNDAPNISRWSSFTTLADGKILVTGGKVERNSGSHRTCMYIDPFKSTYSPAVPMLKGHSSHISLRIFNKVYVISGKNEDNICDSHCEVFDTYTETWSSIGKINFPRTCAAGCYINNCIYVLGGFQNSVCNSIEKYSMHYNLWTLLPTVLPEKIWQHGCFAVDSKRILIFGGEKDSEEPSKVSYVYDITTEGFNSMTNIDTIPVYLYFWIQIIRDGDFLYTINKEKTLVKYSIPDNKWALVDLG
ncbi:hypothetical protein SteCoe_11177 [Stentor coeruleus]|uniref:RING-type domain-containing protein n=1 Tax=Stentor coeruleus TaxID=5963 RepID=A0A1R2CDU3_9CILI|nr:hypothetical protein SteCoe_11177 [Stentor coeruleus]